MFEQVIIIGRLGQDPEIKFLSSGTPLCNFNVATSESYKDAASGEWKSITKWWRVTVWGNFAETCTERLSKGDMVQVTGKIKIPRVYTGNDGQTRSAGLEMKAERIVFLSLKKSTKGAMGEEDGELDLSK